VVIVLPEGLPDVDIMRFWRDLHVEVFDGVGHLFQKFDWRWAEELNADFVLDAVALDGVKKTVAVTAASLEQVAKYKDRSAGVVGDAPDIIGNALRRPKASSGPSADRPERRDRTAAGAAVMVAATNGENRRYRVAQPVLEGDISRRIAIFYRHLQKM